jgi:hypothetical protein
VFVHVPKIERFIPLALVNLPVCNNPVFLTFAMECWLNQSLTRFIWNSGNQKPVIVVISKEGTDFGIITGSREIVNC